MRPQPRLRDGRMAPTEAEPLAAWAAATLGHRVEEHLHVELVRLFSRVLLGKDMSHLCYGTRWYHPLTYLSLRLADASLR